MLHSRSYSLVLDAAAAVAKFRIVERTGHVDFAPSVLPKIRAQMVELVDDFKEMYLLSF